jgi:hypothetical protein
MTDVLDELWPADEYRTPDAVAGVQLVDFDPDGEEKVLAAACYGYLDCSEAEIHRRIATLDDDGRLALLDAYVGDRRNRRHRPGRAFERTGYRFDIVSDYGAFRDLQRHRMLTIDWQPLSCALGYEVPDIVIGAGVDRVYRESLERSADLYHALVEILPEQAPYAVALAYNVRYSMQLNAREAMHVLELRSGPQGHPTYRRIAQEMHRLIRDEAGHRAIAASMHFVDHSDPQFGRLDAEQRAEGRRVEAMPANAVTEHRLPPDSGGTDSAVQRC